MSLNPKAQAALALHRFGFGPKAGSIEAIASDPRGAVLAELEQPAAGRITDATLLTSAQAAREVREFVLARQAEQIRARKRESEAQMGGEGMEKPPEPAPAPAAKPAAALAEPPLPQKLFFQEVLARTNAAVAAPVGFVERLVWFWSNHFCISADKARAMSGGYEREAIRTHVLGRFGDMLLAAESHPAMLVYLDNTRSAGPNSVAGLNRNSGLNENLAREILELHTLGVRSVYTQQDVTTFAKMLTGWTVIPIGPDPEHGATFVFNKRMHEPGPQTMLGRTYPDDGADQARAVLADIARHPATAAHVATKLARHFVADDPPPALVDRLKKRFLDTGGDLKEVAKALVTSAEAWTPKQDKLKRPGEWIVAILRASGLALEARRVTGALDLLGEPLWRPSAPKGFADDNAAWMDGLAQRVDMAGQFAARVADRLDPGAMLDTALGALASRETRDTVARAESRAQAIALLLMAPEFQRR